ncbi:MAG TPA: glutathione S-transferase family protein [Steroidobacteraceae bacterium]|nr:glutathione S-transferase family protein [Steroidobacteraceae bacterium]
MKVFGYPNTRSARAVWALEEAGADYEYQHVNLLKGAARDPSYLQVNPGGKVPALTDGDLTLTESAAICWYVAESYPEATLLPTNLGERAQIQQWCSFAVTELEQPLWSISKHTFALPEKRRVPALLDTAAWEFSRAAGVLALGLGARPHIVGDRFSVADILLANTLSWARNRKVTIESVVLNAYADRMLSRPACVRAVEREQQAAA